LRATYKPSFETLETLETPFLLDNPSLLQSRLSTAHLSGGINNVATGDGALLHEVVDALELAETDGLEGSLDEAAAEEVEGFAGVLTVTDVGTLDGDHLDDSLEDGRAEVGAGRETDADDGATGTNVLSGLLEGLLVDGNKDDGVRTETVFGAGLHVLDDVFAGHEVDEVATAELLQAHFLLIVTGVDSDRSRRLN